MYETLPTGVVKGGLTVQDLNLPPLDTTYADAETAADFHGISGREAVPIVTVAAGKLDGAGISPLLWTTALALPTGMALSVPESAKFTEAVPGTGQAASTFLMPSWNPVSAGHVLLAGGASGLDISPSLEAMDGVNVLLPQLTQPILETLPIPHTPATPQSKPVPVDMQDAVRVDNLSPSKAVWCNGASRPVGAEEAIRSLVGALALGNVQWEEVPSPVGAELFFGTPLVLAWLHDARWIAVEESESRKPWRQP